MKYWLFGVVLTFFLVCSSIHAQEDSKVPPNPNYGQLETHLTTDKSFDPATGYTTWKITPNSGCSFSDHSYTIDIDVDDPVNTMSDIQLSMRNYDVDFIDPNGDCELGPEVDETFFNGNYLGVLQGANNALSTNNFALLPEEVVTGANTIYIDTDAPGTGCWCVGVVTVEVRAKVDFAVDTISIQPDEFVPFKSADFVLTVSFTDSYDPDTVTNKDTFLLEYRDSSGMWIAIDGGFESVTPKEFRFVPSGDLIPGINYRITIKSGANGIKSLSETPLLIDTVQKFKTVPDLDVTKAFADTYLNDACAPGSTSPCKGLEVFVFQVSRDAKIAFGKPAVARIHVRWEPPTGVHTSEQVTDLDFKLKFNGADVGGTKSIQRQDKHTQNDRIAGTNSVQHFFIPASGSSTTFQVEVTPVPQSSANPVTYTGSSVNVGNVGAASTLNFDYHFLEDGDWSGGIPASTLVDGNNLMTTGSKFTKEQYPVLDVVPNRGANFKNLFNRTGTMVTSRLCSGANMVNEVDCFGQTNIVNPAAGSIMDELDCVILNLFYRKASSRQFIAGILPGSLCSTDTGFRLSHIVVFFMGNNPNDGTVAHEISHVYGIGHSLVDTGIDGFHLTSANAGSVRSEYADPSSVVNLMHENVQTIQQWIEDAHYTVLLGKTFMRRSLEETGEHLVISGFANTTTTTVTFLPMTLQDESIDTGLSDGDCLVELQDTTGAVLSDAYVDLGFPASTSEDPVPDLLEGSFFSVSLPFSTQAARVVVTCDEGPTTGTLTKTANEPSVTLESPTAGSTLSGTAVSCTWSGSDADGDAVLYQLQVSQDGGTTWRPETPLDTGTSAVIDTTFLINSADTQIRVMASDGFNVVFDTISVQVDNGLAIRSVFPVAYQTEVSTGTDVRVTLNGDFQLDQVSYFYIWQSGEVPTNMGYDSETSTIYLEPLEPLLPQTSYDVFFSDASSVEYEYWYFTTETDVINPSVTSSSPADGASNIPINALVQVNFNEEIDSSTLRGTEIQLQDSTGVQVAATIWYADGERRVVLTPASDLLPFSEYKIVVAGNVSDLSGNFLDQTYEATFTTSDTTTTGVRIVGNYIDEGVDQDKDGLFEEFYIFADVEVLTYNNYNLNGRLVDSAGRLIEWASTGDVLLTEGTHQLSLRFSGDTIRSSGLDGPYTLDSLSLYQTFDATVEDTVYNAYNTFAYDQGSFFAVMTFGPIPDLFFSAGDTANDVLDLRSLTVHASEPVESIQYEVRVNTDENLSVQIDSNGMVSFVQLNIFVAVSSDVTIDATDSALNRIGGRFEVHFSSASTPEPTQAPSDEPAPEPTQAPTEPCSCFSKASTMQVEGRGIVPMTDLRVNDRVFVGTDGRNNPIYERVYAFGHYDPTSPTDYFRIHTSNYASGHHPLKMSAAHLLYIHGKSHPVRADTVQPGDVLLQENWDKATIPIAVTRVEKITRPGAYMPLTNGGTLVVDGILVSAYVSILEQAPEVVTKFHIFLNLSERDLLHWWLAPYRMVSCLPFTSKMLHEMIGYNVEGIAYWLVIGRYIARVGDGWWWGFQLVGLTVFGMFMGFCMAVESLLAFSLGTLSGGFFVALSVLVLIKCFRMKSAKTVD